MRRNLLDALWVMAVLTSVVLVVVTAGSLLLALTADTSSAIGLDAWRGVVLTAPALILSATALALLTVLRLRRNAREDEALDGMLGLDEPAEAVVHVVATPTVRIAP